MDNTCVLVKVGFKSIGQVYLYCHAIYFFSSSLKVNKTDGLLPVFILIRNIFYCFVLF